MSPPTTTDPVNDVVGDLPVLAFSVLFNRAPAAGLVDRLRIKLSIPAEVFAGAVRPVIEGYAEFVQMLPASGLRALDTPGGLFVHAMEQVLLALDYRRGQILPRGAAPEIIGAAAHRWTYAVFVAALLHDMDSALSSLTVWMWRRDGTCERWSPRAGSLHACGAVSYHVETAEPAAETEDAGERLALLLLDQLVPASVIAWLAGDDELMRELRGFLAGKAVGSGAIGELVLRARAHWHRHVLPDNPVSGRAIAPGIARSVDGRGLHQHAEGIASGAGANARDDHPGHPLPNTAGRRPAASGSALLGGTRAARVLAEVSTPRPSAAQSVEGVDYLEDCAGERPEVTPASSGSHLVNEKAQRALTERSSSQAVSLPDVASHAVPEAAHRFRDWLRHGLADGSLRFNEPGAMVHFVEEGMLLVSPRIFREFAARFGEADIAPGSANAGGGAELGKSVQRRVLRAGWHMRGEKGLNVMTYQVLRGGCAVSRLSGVVMVNPARFISPVPPVNPLLVRLTAGRHAP